MRTWTADNPKASLMTRKRAAIVHAARRAFLENGYGSTSMDQIATAAGVSLHEDPWEMNVLATSRGSAHRPSMLEDVEARRPTEVDTINGALVREAEQRGVEIPLQQALHALVRGREASYR